MVHLRVIVDCIACTKILVMMKIKKLFNLVWHEVRNTVENSYQRLCSWFPLLGNNKKKPIQNL
jgi:hypothetical protein